MEPMVQKKPYPLQEFGPCLKEILKEKQVSASELARMMAYKSRNSIFRILCGKGGHGARQAFYERLMQEDPLCLDDGQRERLGQALEISRVGLKNYLDSRAMHELLLNRGAEPAQKALRIDAADYYPEDPDFSGAMEAMARSQRVCLTILGCCDRAIFDALRKRICRGDVRCEVKIDHMIYTGPEEIVRNIAAIQPLLCCDFYNAYCIEPGMFSRERESIYRSNCIYAHVQDEHGDWYDRQLMLIDKGVFVPLRRMATGECNPIKTFFDRDLIRTPPLKRMPGGDAAAGNGLTRAERCRRLEKNRAVYAIRLGMPVSFVQADILAACVKDSFPEAETAMQDVERMQEQRFENCFTRKKTSHTILPREAMERFARTGRLLSRFHALRSCTPGERVKILQNLRKQEERNPYFHLHFFTDDFEQPVTEMALYEGVGTLMTMPHVSDDLPGDRAETLVTHEEFCARYKAFYLNDLLKRHAMGREETMAVLDELIETAKNA